MTTRTTPERHPASPPHQPGNFAAKRKRRRKNARLQPHPHRQLLPPLFWNLFSFLAATPPLPQHRQDATRLCRLSNRTPLPQKEKGDARTPASNLTPTVSPFPHFFGISFRSLRQPFPFPKTHRMRPGYASSQIGLLCRKKKKETQERQTPTSPQSSAPSPTFLESLFVPCGNPSPFPAPAGCDPAMLALKPDFFAAKRKRRRKNARLQPHPNRQPLPPLFWNLFSFFAATPPLSQHPQDATRLCRLSNRTSLPQKEKGDARTPDSNPTPTVSPFPHFFGISFRSLRQSHFQLPPQYCRVDSFSWIGSSN
jgi:hypothetical protein